MKEEFGRHFATWMMKRFGGKQASIASALDVDVSEVSRIVAGRRNPSICVVAAWLRKMGITLEEFWSDREGTEFQERFRDDILLFHDVLRSADREAMIDIRKALHRALRETSDRALGRPTFQGGPASGSGNIAGGMDKGA